MPEVAVPPRRRSPLSSLALIVSMLGMAVGAWLVPASIHIVEWADRGPTRVALVPPASTLVWMSAAALVLALVVILLSGRHSWFAVAREALIPFGVLWLWVIPFLPELPDRLPVLLALAGPLRWVVPTFAVAIAGARLQLWRYRPSIDMRQDHRVVAACIALAMYLFFGRLSAMEIGPGGDEPHYLVIAQSLLSDGDLKIGNNHEQREYRPFYGGDLSPHFLRRGLDGEIYSIHAPGLAVLLLPAYAVAGYPGSVILMCVLAALASLFVFELLDQIAGHRAAWIAWASVCLGVPFIPHVWLLFPEMPAALIVAVALVWLWRPPAASVWVWMARGVALGFLPWLHTKFVVLLVVLALAVVVRLRKMPRESMAALAPIAILGVAWLFYFYAIYGEFDPQAPYGSAVNEQLSLSYIPRGVLGLIFDPKLGLLWYAPLLVAAVPGAWFMVREERTRWMGALLLMLVATFTLASTRYYMWWGGASAPARFLVPIVPCLAVMVASAVAHARSAASRALIGMALVAGLAIALVGSVEPEYRYFFSDARGYSHLLGWLQGPSTLAAAPPGFSSETWMPSAVSLSFWILIASGACFAVFLVGRARSMTVPGLAAIGALVMFGGVAVIASSPDADARSDAVRRGRQDLVHAYNGDRTAGVDYRARAHMAAEDLLATYPVSVGTEPGTTVSLPAGLFEARVWFRDPVEREGEIVITTTRKITFGRLQGRLESPAVVPFELPVTVERMLVRLADEQVSAAVRRIDIIPQAVVPRSEREWPPVRALDPIGAGLGTLVAHQDENAYPEGGVFWTSGTRRARFLVAPAGAARIVLTIHLGPRTGDVRVSADGREYPVQVRNDGPAVIEIPLTTRGLRVVTVSVQSTTSFQPAQEDPASDDVRWLGAHVEVALR